MELDPVKAAGNSSIEVCDLSVLLLGMRFSRKDVQRFDEFEHSAKDHFEDDAVDCEQEAIKAFPISRPNGEI